MGVVNKKKLCENCMLLMEGAVSLKKMQTASGFKCENCGRQSSIGKVCEITVKKGAAAK